MGGIWIPVKRKLGLTRGWAAADSTDTVDIFGNGSLVAGRGAHCQEFDPGSWFPEKKKVMSLIKWSNSSIHDASPYTADSEYNRLIYGISLTLDSESPVMTLDAQWDGKLDQAGEFTWLGDRYRMRLLRGLLYGVAGPGPEGGHGDLPDVSGLRVNGNTLYSRDAIYNADPTVKPGLMKFQLDGKILYLYGELPSAGDYPPGFVALSGYVGIVAPQYGDDRFAYYGYVALGSRTLFSPQKSILIQNRRGKYTDRTAILGTTYYYMTTVTEPLVRTALPEPLATFTNGETAIRWTNNNPGASTVKLYRDTMGDTNGELDGFQ
ncbi:hypothetical protein SPFM9_00137 [Salmonella phage SPFM9]|nr:hypothetical protein SPFM9_00137 [Salmonella phage SPFM9]